MKTKKLLSLIFFLAFFTVTGRSATLSLPLTKTNDWQFLSYRKIPPNTFRGTPAGLEIGITNSAAPAVLPLKDFPQVIELRVTGKISGSLKLPPKKQGEKGFDDYTVRIGLVESGARTLSWRERKFGPDWVTRLFALAPDGTGIRQIRFFNVGTEPRQIGATRQHPLSELMEETVVAVPDASGQFSFAKKFSNPIKTLAVWISSDGDDTKSSFAVMLTKIEILTKDTTQRGQEKAK